MPLDLQLVNLDLGLSVRPSKLEIVVDFNKSIRFQFDQIKTLE